MVLRCWFLLLLFLLPAHVYANSAGRDMLAEPLSIGETFTIHSKVLNENRRINVYLPSGYEQAKDFRFPVIYMPDGGMGEDFLHVAGLIQVGMSNWTMRPFLLVGIENTQRRRDTTGPTENPEDKKIAPVVGGSEAFRQFIQKELFPQIEKRYRTTNERAIVGESLAGLFVVETFFKAPHMFDTYIAFDPSLWWNKGELVSNAAQRLKKYRGGTKTVYLGSSDQKDIAAATAQLAEILKRNEKMGVRSYYEPMPFEQHSTIYHPAALKAFRTIFPRPTEN